MGKIIFVVDGNIFDVGKNVFVVDENVFVHDENKKERIYFVFVRI